ncbi:hypothetical protein [Flavobacterium sp. 140616W15]|uniref:hypothetical protein n=1 Tax=Flavobacterium sp. 140616W15 TaxID=2478552 RepID=UPI000F0C4ED5|nr:hypothetical protein [Flavobacterium sp. 140616W15]AYN04685.1 hypothetical protein EAG11_11300 [Flavobacterium sp. 140616W15]
MKIKINKIILNLLVLILFNSCTASKSFGYTDTAFKQYLIDTKKMDKDAAINDSYYDKYYLEYMRYEKKQQITSNPYLKVNQVYVHYRTNNSVEFSVYSDEGTFCINTFDLDMNGEILSLPENGIVKVIKPIRVEDFGDFEITNDFIKTRKRSRTPFREWYDYVNGTIKNNTIHFTEKYIGTNRYKLKKKWLVKTRKTDLKEIYQPNLKATKYKDKYGLVYFIVTGEFNVE